MGPHYASVCAVLLLCLAAWGKVQAQAFGYSPAAPPGGYGYSITGLGYAPYGTYGVNGLGVTDHRQGARRRSMLSASQHAPACYCAFDATSQSWALHDTSCREALYRRCDADSSLPCAALDDYYASVASSAGAHHVPQLQRRVVDFLSQDCAQPVTAPAILMLPLQHVFVVALLFGLVGGAIGSATTLLVLKLARAAHWEADPSTFIRA